MQTYCIGAALVAFVGVPLLLLPLGLGDGSGWPLMAPLRTYGRILAQQLEALSSGAGLASPAAGLCASSTPEQQTRHLQMPQPTQGPRGGHSHAPSLATMPHGSRVPSRSQVAASDYSE